MSEPRRCACGMQLGPYTPEWYRSHLERHLGAFPDTDDVTRANLEAAMEHARKTSTRTERDTYGVAR